jgi:hypothetical protein
VARPPIAGWIGVLTILLGVASFGGAATALPSGPPRAVNLVATQSVKAALRAVYLRGTKPADAAKVHGPLPGSVYYGRVGEHYYALATFDSPPAGTTDQPEGFDRIGNGPWRDLGDGFGDYTCKGLHHTTVPPLVLLRDVWYLCGSGHP